MDDLTDKIASILSDPEGMDTIRSLAGHLLSQNTPKEENSSLPSLPITPEQIGSIMSLVSAFKNSDNDDVRLLLALRPHLSEARQKKLDKAVSLLKLTSVLPLLKDSGISSLLGL